MADLSITPTNVLAGADATKETGTTSVSVTAGQVVYRDATTSKYALADANSATAAVRQPRGIALHAAGANQPLTIVRSGPVTIGATLTAGVAYYLSSTPGGIRPVADNTTGDYPCLLGMATSTTVLNLDIQYSGVAL